MTEVSMANVTPPPPLALAGAQPLFLAQVAAAARDFVARLERHLGAEESLLTVPGPVSQGRL